MEKELDAYRATYQEVHGEAAPATILAGWTYCDEAAGHAADVL